MVAIFHQTLFYGRPASSGADREIRPHLAAGKAQEEMLDPVDLGISASELEAAVTLLNMILHVVGDPLTGSVTTIDMHRVISFLAGAVLEKSHELHDAEEFGKVGDYFGKLIAHHALSIRAQREVGVASVLDRAMAMDDPVILDDALPLH